MIRLIKNLLSPQKYEFIHIGKCGGGSSITSMKRTGKYPNMTNVHIRKPIYNPKCLYFIAARDPIARCISAFNWRYRLVVDTEKQKNRFSGEYEILKRYETLTNLAEALYTDGQLNTEAAEHFRSIHHLQQDISHYLSDFLKVCKKEQILGVLMTETLSEDIERLFGCAKEEQAIKHSNKKGYSTQLSSKAKQNLVQFIKGDYEQLRTLYQWGFIKKDLAERIFSNANLQLN